MNTLLICDDEQALTDELAEWFCSRGWHVYVASSVEGARKIMSECGYPDVLLVEQKLPVVDGDKLASIMLASDQVSRPCIIALMGSDGFEPTTFDSHHCDLWLSKPFSPRSACDRFEFALRRSPICAERRRSHNPSSSRVDR
jgi:DNA-binding response OmpR family regulator